MAGITHNVTLQAAQETLVDALCELVEAQEEIARLRRLAERAIKLAAELHQMLESDCNTGAHITDEAALAYVRAEIGPDAAPAGEGRTSDAKTG